MAHQACLSRRRFSQVFREVTGSSPKSYYDTLRLGMAKEMLRTTSLSLIQIAERFGFSSSFHFSKAFRHHFGVPPSEYRKGKKANDV
jgi:transcriptional regulator GlxA family with amidase domain